MQQWFCAQLGGREHYAVPRALHRRSLLYSFMTDYWAGSGARRLAKSFPARSIRSLAARHHSNLPIELVTSHNLRALKWEFQRRHMSRTRTSKDRYLAYCKIGKLFSEALVRSIKTQNLLSDKSIFFGYDTCSLEIMKYLTERGVACVVGQIDPCRVESEMVSAEQLLWPNWEDNTFDVPNEFYERHLQEWTVADCVLVNSNFSRKALIQQGVEACKIEVVPLSFEPVGCGQDLRIKELKAPGRFSVKRPLRVLFLGQVMLRKGIQYLIQAARLLKDYPIIIHVVGPIQISEWAVLSAPANVIFHGRVSRDEVQHWYANADVFVLPTLSDGFAITQIEAMANGVPVITTHNCGSVVTDGVDGVIVAPRDSEALADAMVLYMTEDNLQSHGLAALEKAKQFTLKVLGSNLRNLGCRLTGLEEPPCA